MKIIKLVDKYLEEIFLVPLFSIMVIVISIQVFMRNILNESIPWSEELARYCFIWLVFIGISYAVKKQKHIKITVVFDKFNYKIRNVLSVINILVFISFALIVVFYGYEVAEHILASDQKSPSLRIPIGLVYLAAPVGMLLTVVRLIQDIYFQFKSNEKSEQID